MTYFLWVPPSFSFWVEAFSPQASSPSCLYCSGRLSLPPNTFIFFFFFFSRLGGWGGDWLAVVRKKMWLSKSRMKHPIRLCFGETELAGPPWEMPLRCSRARDGIRHSPARCPLSSGLFLAPLLWGETGREGNCVAVISQQQTVEVAEGRD